MPHEYIRRKVEARITDKAIEVFYNHQRIATHRSLYGKKGQYKSCMGLLKLADKFSVDRLESACEKALGYTASPSYKSIKRILTAGKDKTSAKRPKHEACGF